MAIMPMMVNAASASANKNRIRPIVPTSNKAATNSAQAASPIPPAAAQKLQGLRSEQELRSAAEALGIAPGIVVGRMQHEGWLPHTHFKHLKVSYRWPGGGNDD